MAVALIVFGVLTVSLADHGVAMIFSGKKNLRGAGIGLLLGSSIPALLALVAYLAYTGQLPAR